MAKKGRGGKYKKRTINGIIGKEGWENASLMPA